MVFNKSADLAWLRVGENERAIQVERKASAPAARGCSFYAPDFALKSSHPWLIGESIPLHVPAEAPAALRSKRLPDAAEFAQVHAEILSQIEHGQFSKVVPIIGETFEFADAVRAGMFMPAALERREHQFNYGFECAGEGMCGVTPELLFGVKGSRLQTMALAGTGPVDGPSLLDDPRLRHEHQVVIDHIMEELRPWGRPEAGTTIERRYGKMKHLFTPMQMHLSHRPQFVELVNHLHPTAALGGWPRAKALDWLEKQSLHLARNRFGAPFGFQTDDEMNCVVAIRGVQWAGARAQVMAGCGVVAGSESALEWNEFMLKLSSIHGLLGIDA